MVNGPHIWSNITNTEVWKITDLSLPGRHHTLGCRSGELDVDLPGWHPTVSPVDIMAVMSTGSIRTWCQAVGGFCRKCCVSGRHHGCDVDRVHKVSALTEKHMSQLVPIGHVCPVDRDRVWSTGYTVCAHFRRE